MYVTQENRAITNPLDGAQVEMLAGTVQSYQFSGGAKDLE